MHSNMNGVFVPYAVFNGMEKLDHEQIGRLFEAIMRYGKDGKDTDFDDPMCEVAWSFILPMLDPPAAWGG